MTVSALNRLGREKSPYLRQHAVDPVHWHPWGEEALALARREQRLIFLSIGYATCHWCHVMGRESFATAEVAALLNRCFVPILVDCEERPDINQIYMKSCRLMLDGHGGWPLNVVLTPEQMPVFAGVYLPKTGDHGRPGLLEVLGDLAREWQLRPGSLRSKGKRLIAEIREHLGGPLGAYPGEHGEIPDGGPRIGPATLAVAMASFRDEFDPVNGGFGPDPRFIGPFGLIFLLRRAHRLREPELTAMVEQTLTAIRRGGITDQLGGGVHRYATDIRWRIPHFEKMLYDQAGLMLALVEARKATGRAVYGEAIRNIARYVLRDLTSEEGLFLAGEDADSEGEEGGHFVWSRAEIIATLGENEGELFCLVYEVAEEGNFRRDARGRGINVLYRTKATAAWAAELKMPLPELTARVDKARLKLLARRRRRQPPARDSQVVTAWNGLMISALAAAGEALGEASFLAAAQRAADRILSRMYCNGSLAHGVQDGHVQGQGFAADYLFFALALLDLHAATLETGFLQQSLTLARRALRLFRDGEGGGLFETAENGEALVVRFKDVEEREMPSTNSAALELFGRLWRLTDEEEWHAAALEIIKGCGGRVAPMPGDFPWFLDGAARLFEPCRKVCVTGRRGDPATEKLIAATRRVYAPDSVVLFRTTDRPEAAFAAICDDRSCQPPVSDPEELEQVLRGEEANVEWR